MIDKEMVCIGYLRRTVSSVITKDNGFKKAKSYYYLKMTSRSSTVINRWFFSRKEAINFIQSFVGSN